MQNSVICNYDFIAELIPYRPVSTSNLLSLEPSSQSSKTVELPMCLFPQISSDCHRATSARSHIDQRYES